MAIEVITDRVHHSLAHPALACRRLGAVRFAEASVAVDASRLAALRAEAGAQALIAADFFRDGVAHRAVCAGTARGGDGVRLRAAQAKPAAIVALRDDSPTDWRGAVDERRALAHRLGS